MVRTRGGVSGEPRARGGRATPVCSASWRGASCGSATRRAIRPAPTRRSAGALASYRRAIAIAEAVRARRPDDVEAMRTLAMAHRAARRRAGAGPATWPPRSPMPQRSGELFAEIAARRRRHARRSDRRPALRRSSSATCSAIRTSRTSGAAAAATRYAGARDVPPARRRGAERRCACGAISASRSSASARMHEAPKRWPEAAAAYQESFEIRRGAGRARAVAPRHPARPRHRPREAGQLQRASGAGAACRTTGRRWRSSSGWLPPIPPTPTPPAPSPISREILADALRERAAGPRRSRCSPALDAHRGFAAQDRDNAQARCDAARVAESLGDVLAAGRAPGACEAWRESLRDCAGAGARHGGDLAVPRAGRRDARSSGAAETTDGQCPDAGDVTRLLEQASAGDDAARVVALRRALRELRRLAASAMRAERADTRCSRPRSCTRPSCGWPTTTAVREPHPLPRRRGRGDAAHPGRARPRPQRAEAGQRRHARHPRRHRRLPRRRRRSVDLVVLDDALSRLAALDARQARIVELRFFGGLTVEETAAVVGVAAHRQARMADGPRLAEARDGPR